MINPAPRLRYSCLAKEGNGSGATHSWHLWLLLIMANMFSMYRLSTSSAF